MPRRFRSRPEVWWAWACIAIFASGGFTLFIDVTVWTLPLGYALGTAYPALLLAGALRYADRRVPGALVPAAFALGLARGVAALLGWPSLAYGAALAVEPGLTAIAAFVLVGAPLRGAPTLAQRVLPAAHLAIAVLDAATALTQLGGAPPPQLLLAWLVGGPLLLALQLTAWSARSLSDLERVRELLEARVVAERDRYRTVSELSSDFSFSYRIEPGGVARERWVTDAVTRVTGRAREELEERGWLDIVHPADRAPLVRRLDGLFRGEQDSLSIDHRILRPDGEERWLNLRVVRARALEGGAVELVGAARDITERVTAENERREHEVHVRELQRLEALGRLAGGIAHDFNNVLTAILGNTQLALEDLGAGSLGPQRLLRVRAAAEFAAGLTEQILTYAGKGAASLEAVDLSRLVHEVRDLLEATVAERGRLELELARDLPCVEGDVTQLRQLLLNLLTNASEALQSGSGRLTIRTGVRDVAAQELAEAVGEPLAPGPAVFLAVDDTGAGFSPEERGRIFEPFFTTKESGRGLGLASVLGIVRGHGGAIRILSVSGQGSTFEVLLPVSPRVRRDAPASVPEVPAAAHGSVLVVDDDAGVRDVAREFLSRAGFGVQTAASGAEAIGLVCDAGQVFDAVLLDLVMPDLSGEEVFLALRGADPGLPVVLASGYDREQAAARFSARGVAGFVRKPFGPEDLLRQVRSALRTR